MLSKIEMGGIKDKVKEIGIIQTDKEIRAI